MHEPTYKPLRQVARDLGLPLTYLERKADAGQIPYLKAGRRTMANREAVEAALAELADKSGEREGVADAS